MSVLLDTHFIVWLATDQCRAARYRWLDKHAPWTVSPVSLLELQYLCESQKRSVRTYEFGRTLGEDPRFVIDEPSALPLFERALRLSWTRDTFDRLLCAHSEIRRLPLCTLDRHILEHHRYIPRELRD